MPSRKRPTTSKSGGSGKSTKKRDTSGRTPNSSPTPTASFEKVFGRAQSIEELRARDQLERARDRLSWLRGTPTPTLPLLRRRHTAKLAQTSKHVRDLEQYLESLKEAD